MKMFRVFAYEILVVISVFLKDIKASDVDKEEIKQEIIEAGCPFKSTNQLLVRNICLMPKYHSNEPPNGLYTRTNVFIQLDGAFVLEVDEKNHKFTIQISENLQWLEPRMRTNFLKVPKDIEVSRKTRLDIKRAVNAFSSSTQSFNWSIRFFTDAL